MSRNPHIGSNFDDFLREEGLFEEVAALAAKKILAEELRTAMREEHVSEVELARRMKTSRTSVRNLLDPSQKGVTLLSVSKAAAALNRDIAISVIRKPAKAAKRASKRKAASR